MKNAGEPAQGAKGEALRVGATIWYFDQNRRKYKDPPPGRLWSDGGPIYRFHWREVEIKGENSRSWTTSYGKAPKSGPHPGWAFSEAEVDDNCWVNGHRAEISQAVRQCSDAEALRKIAAILGWEPK